MDKIMIWGRAFPIVTIIVCVVLIVVFKKMFGKEGASGGNTWIYLLIALIAICVGVAVWGFNHVKPPDNSGMTWK